MNTAKLTQVKSEISPTKQVMVKFTFYILFRGSRQIEHLNQEKAKFKLIYVCIILYILHSHIFFTQFLPLLMGKYIKKAKLATL